MKQLESKSMVLLRHHLKVLRLPTFGAEAEKVAAQCSQGRRRPPDLPPAALRARALGTREARPRSGGSRRPGSRRSSHSRRSTSPRGRASTRCSSPSSHAASSSTSVRTTEPHWDSWRLLTLETRMGAWQLRSRNQHGPRRADTPPRTRLRPSDSCAHCATSLAGATAPFSALRTSSATASSPCAAGSTRPTLTTGSPLARNELTGAGRAVRRSLFGGVARE